MNNKNTILAIFFGGFLGFLIPSASFATNTATFTGTAVSNNYGQSIAAGDLDGDGYQDLLVGASGGSYISVTYGTGEILSSTTVSTDTAVLITGGSSTDFFGTSMATGDINADGYDDVLVGALGSNSNAGAVYVIYGRATRLVSGAVESDSANIKFTGSSEKLGSAVVLGDLNGDGFMDLVIGGKTNSTSSALAGVVYILYGRSTTFSNGTMASVASAQLTGEVAGDTLGSSLAVGDLNGDGLAELVAGAPNNDDAGVDAGAAYVVYGSAAVLSGTASIGTGSSELTGEVAGDLAGEAGGLAISRQSLDGDVYNDLLVGAVHSDDGATNAGAVYVISGSATSLGTITSLGSSTFLELMNSVSGSGMPSSLATGDFNQDGLGDLVIGTPYVSFAKGGVFVVPGSDTEINLAIATTFIGNSSGDIFGTTVAVQDLNGDNFPELLMGANGYNAGDGTGAVLIDYPYIDADLDGLPGTEGVFSSIDATYFNATVTFDTNDSIPNNGIEIDGDEIDNDGDGEIDEHNTIAENGAHPYYSTLAAADNASANIISVVGRNHGKITVTYADNSVYDLNVFSTSSSHSTTVEQYKATGYAVVLKRSGTKAVLLDLYTGDKADTQDLSSTATASADLLLDDVRNDGKTEAVVTTKIKSKVKVFLIQVKKKTGKINLYDKLVLHNKNVDTSKTRTHKKKLQLRSSSNKVLTTLNVSKQYQLSV